MNPQWDAGGGVQPGQRQVRHGPPRHGVPRVISLLKACEVVARGLASMLRSGEPDAGCPGSGGG